MFLNRWRRLFLHLGGEDEAHHIDVFGEEIMKGAAVDAVQRVKMRARELFPSWIVIRKLPSEFNWKMDMRKNEVVLGVLLASDDSCSHAVTLHGNFIYDANEAVALPLCDEALDYCTSTATVKSTFVAFKFGYRFFYAGEKSKRQSRMTLYK